MPRRSLRCRKLTPRSSISSGRGPRPISPRLQTGAPTSSVGSWQRRRRESGSSPRPRSKASAFARRSGGLRRSVAGQAALRGEEAGTARPGRRHGQNPVHSAGPLRPAAEHPQLEMAPGRTGELAGEASPPAARGVRPGRHCDCRNSRRPPSRHRSRSGDRGCARGLDARRQRCGLRGRRPCAAGSSRPPDGGRGLVQPALGREGAGRPRHHASGGDRRGCDETGPGPGWEHRRASADPARSRTDRRPRRRPREAALAGWLDERLTREASSRGDPR